MDKVELVRDVAGGVAIVGVYITAVLALALLDVAMTWLLIRLSAKIKKASELPQPEVPLPQLPDDHKVVVLGGAVKRWE
jgi:hypothetical protein